MVGGGGVDSGRQWWTVVDGGGQWWTVVDSGVDGGQGQWLGSGGQWWAVAVAPRRQRGGVGLQRWCVDGVLSALGGMFIASRWDGPLAGLPGVP